VCSAGALTAEASSPVIQGSSRRCRLKILELLPKYCWETNTNYDAVKLMLDVGFPIAHIERSHGYTALHNAALGGIRRPRRFADRARRACGHG
jgi:hypothetical protein